MEHADSKCRYDPKKEVACQYCDKEMTRNCLSKHVNGSCVVNKLFNKTKKEILMLIDKKCPDCETSREETAMWKENCENLKRELEKYKAIAENLQSEFEINNNKNNFNDDILEMIVKMNVKDKTRREYKREWRKYFKWSEINIKSPLLPIAAEEYLK